MSTPRAVAPDRGRRKRTLETKAPRISKAKLDAMIEEATADAYDDEEAYGGFLDMLEEHLALPFSVSILGVEAVVEEVVTTADGRLAASCRRDRIRQRIGLLDLPLPKPAPAGWEWIAAYRYWRTGAQ